MNLEKVKTIVSIVAIVFTIWLMWCSMRSINRLQPQDADDDKVDPPEELDKESEEELKKASLPPDLPPPQLQPVHFQVGAGVKASSLKKITPEFLLEEFEKPEVVEAMRSNALKLTGQKILRYNQLKEKYKGTRGTEKIVGYIEKAITRCRKALVTLENRVLYRKNLILAIKHSTRGLMAIKGEAREEERSFIAQDIYLLSKSHEPFNSTFLNYMIIGDAGTGKTLLAEVIAFVYSKTGILASGHAVPPTSAKDYVAEYLGQSESKLERMLMGNLESVVFIDEIYGLCPKTIGGGTDVYREAIITEMVNFLDKYQGFSMLIGGGYRKRVENEFFGSNEGMKRRFPKVLDLKNYTSTDGLTIVENILFQKYGRIPYNTEYRNLVYSVIDELNRQKMFPNHASDYVELANSFIRILSLHDKRTVDDQELFFEIFNNYCSTKGRNFTQ